MSKPLSSGSGPKHGFSKHLSGIVPEGSPQVIMRWPASFTTAGLLAPSHVKPRSGLLGPCHLTLSSSMSLPLGLLCCCWPICSFRKTVFSPGFACLEHA